MANNVFLYRIDFTGYNRAGMKYVWDWKQSYENEDPKEIFDCFIAEYLLSDGRGTPEKEKTLEKYKVSTLEELGKKQQLLLQDLPTLSKLLHEIEIPLIPILITMEKNGIELDCECLKKVGADIDTALVKIKEKILDVVGYEINISSPAQMGTFLAEKEGVPLAKTKTGQYATNEQELLKYQGQFPIIETLLTYRELTKIKSTYIDSLISKVDEFSRVHTTYSLVGVNTGRLSSSNPNLQNIPVATEQGRKIKECFVASIGKILLSFDYSQQELRILAHLSQEERLIDAFNNNQDIHKTTASQIFKVDYEKVTKEQRSIAKTINFGIVYGMSSYGMSEGLQIPIEEAEKFIKEFYKTYPKIKSYYDTYMKNAQVQKYAETMLGRRRFVFAYPGQKFLDNATRRVLMNYPIQGSAAELTKMAMIAVYEKVLKNRDDLKLLLQIHDELVFEIDEDNEKRVDETVHEIQKVMIDVFPLSVPVEVGVKVGKKWGSLKSFTPLV